MLEVWWEMSAAAGGAPDQAGQCGRSRRVAALRVAGERAESAPCLGVIGPGGISHQASSIGSIGRIRRRSYRSLASLQRDNRACRACAEAGYPLESRPVFAGHVGQKALIVGQAPGIVEGVERRPWRGRAGRTLRAWLELDEDAFYETFYCSSVTRCDPGRHPSGRGDRAATPREHDLCAFWLDWELRLLQPELVLPLGGLAVRRLLGRPRLTECIGERYELGSAVAVPLPHPSGASGWLNDAGNRERLRHALALVREELTQLTDRAGS